MEAGSPRSGGRSPSWSGRLCTSRMFAGGLGAIRAEIAFGVGAAPIARSPDAGLAVGTCGLGLGFTDR